MRKKLHIGSIAWLICLVALGILSLSAAGYKQKAKVVQVKVHLVEGVSGTQFLTEADLEAHALKILGDGSANTVGLVDLKTVEESFRHHPFIKTVEAYVSGNNVMHLKVSQREPLFRVIDRRGKGYYIDRDGYKMPLSTHYTARVPVATAVTPFEGNRITEENRNAWHLYNTMLYIDADPFLKSLTDQVYQQADGDLVLVPSISDAVIMIGGGEDLELKFEKLRLFCREVLPEEGWNAYATINLSYDGQIVCKRQDGK